MGGGDLATGLLINWVPSFGLRLRVVLFARLDWKFGAWPADDLTAEMPVVAHPDIGQACIECQVIDLISDLSGKIEKLKSFTRCRLCLKEMQL